MKLKTSFRPCEHPGLFAPPERVRLNPPWENVTTLWFIRPSCRPGHGDPGCTWPSCTPGEGHDGMVEHGDVMRYGSGKLSFTLFVAHMYCYMRLWAGTHRGGLSRFNKTVTRTTLNGPMGRPERSASKHGSEGKGLASNRKLHKWRWQEESFRVFIKVAKRG